MIFRLVVITCRREVNNKLTPKNLLSNKYYQPLFQEEIQAWLHGPVIPELYSHYKPYGSVAIPLPSEVDFENYDANTRDLLDDVYNVYGQYSAWKLRDLTHQEPPLVDAAKAGLNSVISHSSLRAYFKTQLTE